MKRLIIVVALVLFATVANAQPSPPGNASGNNKIGWDQDAPTLKEAQEYTYKYYADGATTGIVLTSVTCVGTVSPFQCEVPFPAFTPGAHTLTLTTGNLAGESPKSLPLSFTFVIIPATPTGLKVK